MDVLCCRNHPKLYLGYHTRLVDAGSASNERDCRQLGRSEESVTGDQLLVVLFPRITRLFSSSTPLAERNRSFDRSTNRSSEPIPTGRRKTEFNNSSFYFHSSAPLTPPPVCQYVGIQSSANDHCRARSMACSLTHPDDPSPDTARRCGETLFQLRNGCAV